MTLHCAEERARALELAIPDSIVPAGHYALCTAYGGLLYLSGQLPRVDDRIAVTGRVGREVGLSQAREAARLCTLRALAVLRAALGTLNRVEQVLRLHVHVQCDADFTLHTEVADAASELLVALFGAAGHAARTAVGAYQLPKNASVEVDLVVAAPAAALFLKESHHAAPR